MKTNPLENLDRILSREGGYTQEHSAAPTARKLQAVRAELLEQIREVGRSGDLSLIIATEHAIVEGDLTRYANSQSMTSSLKTALNEIDVIKRHIGIVDDPEKYKEVDQAYSLPRNRKGGLPFDEARQALASHYTRLNNMDKSRSDDDEKKIIDARKSAVFAAGKLYAERQAKSLGIDISKSKRQGRRL